MKIWRWNLPGHMHSSHQPVCSGQETQLCVSAQILEPAPAPQVSLMTAELFYCKQVCGTNIYTLTSVSLVKTTLSLTLTIPDKNIQLQWVQLSYLMLSIQQSTPMGTNMLRSIHRGNQVSVFWKHSQWTTVGLSIVASSWFPKLPGTARKHTVNHIEGKHCNKSI